MALYQSPEDEAVFTSIMNRDPESKKCFECNYPNAPWCDINHGIFVCLDCSGVHRGLGVHLSFVRSSTMDGWSNWRPEKLRQMELGGNAKARKFFEAKGVPKAPIRARYEHVGALMYKDYLEAAVAGRPFNEATWTPPDWAVPKPPQQQQQGRGGSAAAASGDRFRGQGSAPQRSATTTDSTSDWLGALSSGLSTVASQATVLATTAATVTVQSSQQLATKIQQQTAAVKTDDLSKKASETAAVATSAVTSAWGALSSWTTSAVSSLAAVTTGGTGGNDDDDGLGSLTRNLQTGAAPAAGAQQQDARFRGVEHRAERPPSELASLTSNLPRTGKYEGLGGDDTPTNAGVARAAPTASRTPVQQEAQRQNSSPAFMGSRQTSQNNVAASPVARQSATSSPPVTNQAPSPSAPKPASSSPVPPATSNAAPSSGEKKAIPADWGWDDE